MRLVPLFIVRLVPMFIYSTYKITYGMLDIPGPQLELSSPKFFFYLLQGISSNDLLKTELSSLKLLDVEQRTNSTQEWTTAVFHSKTLLCVLILYNSLTTNS